MSILNVNQIQPVGGGNTITVNASDVSASGVTITASSFVGPVTGNVTGNVTSSSTSTFSSGINVTGGSVGIGIDNPDAKLEVRDTASQGVIIRSLSTQATNTNKALRIRNNSNTDTFSVSHKGELTLAENIVIASGKGIDFSATGNATGMTNELLDDYEEGTYTVVMSDSGSGTITASTSDDQAQYTKIGNLVTVSGRPLVGSKSSPTGDLKISLPFVPAALAEAAERSPASLYIRLCESGSNVNNFQAALSSTASLQFGYASGTDHVTSGNRVKAGTQIWFSVTYRVA